MEYIATHAHWKKQLPLVQEFLSQRIPVWRDFPLVRHTSAGAVQTLVFYQPHPSHLAGNHGWTEGKSCELHRQGFSLLQCNSHSPLEKPHGSRVR